MRRAGAGLLVAALLVGTCSSAATPQIIYVTPEPTATRGEMEGLRVIELGFVPGADTVRVAFGMTAQACDYEIRGPSSAVLSGWNTSASSDICPSGESWDFEWGKFVLTTPSRTTLTNHPGETRRVAAGEVHNVATTFELDAPDSGRYTISYDGVELQSADLVAPPPKPTPKPTLKPTPKPTLAPTPTPAPTTTEAALISACSGRSVPQAAKYGGTVHPLVVVDEDGDISTPPYEINLKWIFDEWPSPIQLVLCVDDPIDVKVGSCGTYTRKSDGQSGEIVRYKYTQKVRVIVATTGKQTGYKTLAGDAPSCAKSLSLSASGPPPWRYYGGLPSDESINTYATSVAAR